MNPDQTINLNQNAAQCIHNAAKFGEDIYYNICNGAVNHVPWGGGDWALAIFFMAFGASIILIMLGVAFWMFFGEGI